MYLKKIIKYFTNLKKKFKESKKNNTSEEHNNSIKLLPLSSNKKLSGSNYEVYKESLISALSNDNVRNLAITGKYGSGKSSVIDSFFNQDNIFKIKPLKVSFANFDDKNKKEMSDENNDNKEETLQDMHISSNIINQIIYQIKRSKIPLTNFKIKKPISMGKLGSLILEVILILMYINFRKLLTSLYIYQATYYDILKFFICLNFVIITLFFLRSLDISKFKINVKDIQTDIDNSNDSLFEKYSDEVIYLFEKSEKRFHKNSPRVLIIEDLDRFDSISIFEKFRELNRKLNNSSKNRWVFIYLLKDDIFNDFRDRTKFFDEIIPIVPFITTNNSFEKLKELFPSKDNNFDNLLYQLSLYIDDYRIIRNIRNEYTIFLSIIETKNKNKILALIAYKNLFPDDFDDIQNGKGCLGDIFDNYVININEQIEDINNKINELNTSYNDIPANDEAEFIYLYGFRNNRTLHSSNSVYNSFVRNKDEIEHLIKNNSLFISTSYNNSINYSDFKSSDDKYIKELSNFIDHSQKIQKLRNEKNKFSSKKLYLINRSLIDELSNKYPDNKDNFELLYVLIKYKYIDEDYLNVINNFYGNKNDKLFIRHLYSDSEEYDINMPLKDINGIIVRLNDSEYTKPQILNISFLRFIANNSKYKSKFHSIIETAINDNEHFIESSINYDESLYNKVLNEFPDFKFNLSFLNEKFFENIILNNQYIADRSNLDMLINYMKNNNYDNSKYLEIINNPNIKEDLISDIIYMSISPVNLSEINNKQYWNQCIKHNKIIPSIKNLNDYFSYINNELNNLIINFINNNKFNFSNIDKILLRQLLLCNSINNSTYYELCLSVPNKSDYFIISDISKGEYNLEESKKNILIENGLLKVDVDLLVYINDENKQFKLPNIYKEKLKNILFNNNIKVNKYLTNLFIERDDSESHIIISRNLNNYKKTRIVNYLDNIHLKEKHKIVKILHNYKGYKNIQMFNNEFNINVFQWMKNENIILKYYVNSNNKIQVK